ncbi:VOC family protein [Candidatus Uhrbacteria bacterium]|nr:VOC family protein [Candidatus Uhrbacteria bacterium]
MNPIIHFEMPAEDRKRMSDFYATVFGWRTKQLGPEMGDYVLVTTTESDAQGRPREPGAINGGFYQKTDDARFQHPSVVISVEDIKAQMQQVESAGGTVVGEIMDIPNVGQYVSFLDTEGNRVGMLQPAPMV